jgi:hypothetical protein
MDGEESRMKMIIASLLLLPLFAFADDGKVRLGKYSCIVEEAHPNSGLAKSYLGDRLEYDADKGVLQEATSIEIDGKLTWLPPQTICSRLFVDTYPSTESNLYAVQFDKTGSGYRPFVAWLMIETKDDELRPYFKFFSSGIVGLVTGRCTHL